jgi:membrane associated rhomboid family serine protease
MSTSEDADYALALSLSLQDEDFSSDLVESREDPPSMYYSAEQNDDNKYDVDLNSPTVVSGGSFHSLGALDIESGSNYAIQSGNEGTQQVDDRSFAWILQQLEFEIPYETPEEIREREINGEFEGKEYKASKCKNQLTTISTLLVFIQIILFWIMTAKNGIDDNNPMTGPSSLTLIKWGAKSTVLILYRNQWWRLFTPIMLHGGVIHLLSNTLIQLRVGGYLNIIFNNYIFFLIYLLSGVFGNICSCIFLPEAISVGASGALLGILSSWAVWIIYRWKKIPDQLRSQRNCQITMVVVCITITLAMSFTTYVDWAAHFGGSLIGALLAVGLLAHELDDEQTKLYCRISSFISVTILLVYCSWYLAVEVKPETTWLNYYDMNGISEKP